MALRALYDVAAPAKLNLFLHVVGRRADGYHLLQSVFALLDWCDSLHFELRDDGRLARHDLGVALPADDLCLRAARALAAASGTPLGADISIEKRVPSGAGMGGGSSDAASTLLALNLLWRLRWPRERLAVLALELGADVPFFLGAGNALVEGVGERLTPLALLPRWLAVVKPAASLATRAIFASPLLGRSAEADIVKGFIGAGSVRARDGLDEVWSYGCNDLQAAAEAGCAEVAQAVALLQARFGNSRMTGSGSAVFARAGRGERPAEDMPADLPVGWTGRMCRSLATHPLAGWAD
ncbi:MAG TPA: 4-(cytidine 5'-diphospho)-2-C-methyl-D-erythritol kinase [Caldimonas sp.]